MNLFRSKLFYVVALAAVTLHLFGREASSVRESHMERLRYALDESSYSGNDSERNRRLFGAVFALHAAANDRQDPYILLEDALAELPLDPDYRQILKANLVDSYLMSDQLGLYTSKNRARMSRGELPTITLGGFKGDTAQCVPLISSDLAPEAEILLANLVIAPTPLVNRHQGAAPSPDSYHCAMKLHDADMISYASFQRVASMVGE